MLKGRASSHLVCKESLVSEKIKKKIFLSWSEKYFFIFVFICCHFFFNSFQSHTSCPPPPKKRNHYMCGVGGKTVSPPIPAFNDPHVFYWKDAISCFISFAAHRFPSSMLSTRKAVGAKEEFLKGCKSSSLAQRSAVWVPVLMGLCGAVRYGIVLPIPPHSPVCLISSLSGLKLPEIVFSCLTGVECFKIPCIRSSG